MSRTSIIHWFSSRATFVICLVLVAVASSARNAAAAETPCHLTKAAWTVLVYLNGDNNLELDAFLNFRQMKRAPSTTSVNVIVQFDRNGQFAPEEVFWARTLRFCVQSSTRPLPSDAVQDMGPVSLNMADGATLRDFVEWGMKQYPADHYALIIWDHGQGWRNIVVPSAAPLLASAPAATGDALPDRKLDATTSLGWPFRSALSPPYKSASSDWTSKDELYNRRIQDALTPVFASKKLDLLGFDSCLMQMIETAYAMRDIAKLQVGSEDDEPGYGWRYDDWLAQLEATYEGSKPGMNERDLANTIVQSYKTAYAPYDPTTTLSVVDLAQIKPLADAVSLFGDALRDGLTTNVTQIRAARAASAAFGPYPTDPVRNGFFGIDLAHFAGEVASRTTGTLRDRALQARNAALGAVITNYAGSDRGGKFGASGIAIYFPATLTEYRSDRFALGGYEPGSNNYPVEFVDKERWTTFLHAYWLAP